MKGTGYTLILFCLSGVLTSAIAQQSIPSPHSGESAYTQCNRLQRLSKTGNVGATKELAHLLFSSVGIAPDAADALGYTGRLVAAEADFVKGQHSTVKEDTVVLAVNNFVTTVGGAMWTHTNKSEVRKLHMQMTTLYPQLMVDPVRRDSKGHYEALHDGMGPMEAVYLASYLLFQKLNNPDYQFTEAERSNISKMNADDRAAALKQRSHEARALISGQAGSVSVRDIIAGADNFFDDLGITSNAVANNRESLVKGGK